MKILFYFLITSIMYCQETYVRFLTSNMKITSLTISQIDHLIFCRYLKITNIVMMTSFLRISCVQRVRNLKIFRILIKLKWLSEIWKSHTILFHHNIKKAETLANAFGLLALLRFIFHFHAPSVLLVVYLICEK